MKFALILILAVIQSQASPLFGIGGKSDDTKDAGVAGVISSVANSAGDVVGKITDVGKEVSPEADQQEKNILQKTGDAFSNIKDKIVSWWAKLKLATVPGQVKNTIEDAVTNGVDNLKDLAKLDPDVSKVKGDITSALKDGVKIASGSVDNIKVLAPGQVDQAKEMVEGLTGNLGAIGGEGGISSAVDVVSNPIEKAQEIVGGLGGEGGISSAVDGFKNVVSSPIDALTGGLGSMGGLLGNSKPVEAEKTEEKKGMFNKVGGIFG